MSALLEVEELRVNYGKVEAVHNIGLKVEGASYDLDAVVARMHQLGGAAVRQELSA